MVAGNHDAPLHRGETDALLGMKAPHAAQGARMTLRKMGQHSGLGGAPCLLLQVREEAPGAPSQPHAGPAVQPDLQAELQAELQPDSLRCSAHCERARCRRMSWR